MCHPMHLIRRSWGEPEDPGLRGNGLQGFVLGCLSRQLKPGGFVHLIFGNLQFGDLFGVQDLEAVFPAISRALTNYFYLLDFGSKPGDS